MKRDSPTRSLPETATRGIESSATASSETIRSAVISSPTPPSKTNRSARALPRPSLSEDATDEALPRHAGLSGRGDCDREFAPILHARREHQADRLGGARGRALAAGSTWDQ